MTEQKGFFESGSPKVMFMFGVSVGVAASLLGNMIFGMVPPSAAGTNNVGNTQNAAAIQAAAQAAGQEPTVPSVPVKGIQANDHIKGNKNAKVVMIEYSDFECPFCARHHPTMEQIMQKYPNDVAWVMRHYPLSFHPNAQSAAEASECAAEQGKFWEYGDKLFANQTVLSQNLYTQIAKDLKLNEKKFSDCMASGKYRERIAQDTAEGSTYGVTGTPATFINGQLVSGAFPFETFEQIIKAAIGQ